MCRRAPLVAGKLRRVRSAGRLARWRRHREQAPDRKVRSARRRSVIQRSWSPGSRVPGSQVPGSQVPGSQASGSPVPGSQASSCQFRAPAAAARLTSVLAREPTTVPVRRQPTGTSRLLRARQVQRPEDRLVLWMDLPKVRPAGDRSDRRRLDGRLPSVPGSEYHGPSYPGRKPSCLPLAEQQRLQGAS